MHRKLSLGFVALLLVCSAASAGPYRSVVIVGSNANPDFTLEVPAGKAITIHNFIDNSSTELASLNVVINSVSALTLVAVDPGVTATQKDVTIDGPATITVNSAQGHTAVLNYKLFAN